MVKPWILEQQPFIFGDKKDKDRKPLYIVLTCLGVLFILLGALPSDSERETRQVGIWNRYSSVKWGTAQQQQTVFTSTVEEMGKNKGKKPDYGRFIWHSDLHEWDDRKGLGGRLIVIGDVHGMHKAVEQMLTELDYSSSQDTLVFVGDLIAKHPSLQSSLDTLSYLRSLNAHSVRGNHDQSVISFRAYFAENYRRTHPSPDTLTDAQVEEFDYSTWEALDAPAPLANWHPLPKDWTWGSEHWKLARKMSNADATWLANLPLTIHIRPIHAYVIHAGLLPWTVPRSGLSALSDANYTAAVEEGGGSVDEEGWLPPDLLGSLKPDYFAPMTKKTTEYIMNSLEHSVLMVEQNRDPYTLIEVRGVKKHGRPSKKDSGKPWHKIWNKSMRNCRIFSDTVEQFGIQALELEDEPIESRDLQDEDTGTAEGLDVDSEQEGEGDEDSDDDDDDDGENEEETSTKDIVVQRMKACRKLNVIYGHWAGQGLNINKHTFGLDSGAVYGRKLSALIISPHGTYSTERKSSRLQFQDIKVEGRKAVIATLKCKQP